jgi:hypothetical protein
LSGPLVRDALVAELSEYSDEPLTGIRCLARGADQVFARVVLDLGGTLETVLPLIIAPARSNRTTSRCSTS